MIPEYPLLVFINRNSIQFSINNVFIVFQHLINKQRTFIDQINDILPQRHIQKRFLTTSYLRHMHHPLSRFIEILI
ncbi:hypothetical protein BST28156_02508 [Burkholderia stagnalis]|nr:hypothetical protein BST28156_02508 [Burkholderia stagnalis]